MASITFGIREIKTTFSWLIVLFDNYCFVNLIEQFSFVTFYKSDVFILAVLTSLVHYQNHKNVLCKSYLTQRPNALKTSRFMLLKKEMNTPLHVQLKLCGSFFVAVMPIC